MVHHNPGEKPFNTAFINPEKLVEYHYNGQVFKHINCVATFAELNKDIFPEGSEEMRWLMEFSKGIRNEINRAKGKGLKVFYHIDLFVLPKRLVEIYKDDICIDGTDFITIDKEMTLKIHSIMIDEIFRTYPEVDGFIIRVGETYLEDTPYHTGNGAVPLRGQFADPATEKDKYVKLLNFLREEVCVKHGRYLIHRTWDTSPVKFHANLDYYLYVTDRVEPHEKLLFSIKHTALDFWRRVKFNDCLTKGKHPQIIEVQCQREYEGKGAYPNYIMDGVINGFEEIKEKKVIKDIINHPLIKGVYTWSRDGGWYGPYLQNEFWCDLNAYVIANYAADPSRTEEEIFKQYCREKTGLNEKDTEIFRKICLLAARAVLKGRYCEAYDKTLDEKIMPTGNWMRDDRLGGYLQLNDIYEYLYQNNLFEAALKEKEESVALWKEIKELSSTIHVPDSQLKEYIEISTEYAVLLFSVVLCGWEIMVEGFKAKKTGTCDYKKMKDRIMQYDKLWSEYRKLKETHPCCATLYEGRSLAVPYEKTIPGLDAAVDECRQILRENGF